MGHVIPNFYENWSDIILRNDSQKLMFWWYVIYSFHMPLFFFVSGYLTCKQYNNLKDLYIVIKRRTISLLLPFIVSGALFYYICGGNYWFLRALYEIVIIVVLYDFCSQKCRFNKYILDFLFFSIMILVLNYGSCFGVNIAGLLEIRRVDLFIAFFFGYLLRKYPKFELLIMNNHLYSICLVIWALLFMKIDLSTGNYWYVNTLCSLSATVCIFSFFRVCKFNKVFFRILCYIGKLSLDIYIIHAFFYPRVPSIGGYLMILCQTNIFRDFLTANLLTLILSFFISVIVVSICLVISRFVQYSTLLSLLFLGKTNR